MRLHAVALTSTGTKGANLFQCYKTSLKKVRSVKTKFAKVSVEKLWLAQSSYLNPTEH